MSKPLSRIEREKKTVQIMIELYCQKKHGTKGSLCADCQHLLAYAHQRLDKCKFGNHKSTCSKCPIHCYKPDMKEQIIEVMRFSGPRMMYTHPIIAIKHLLDERR